MDAIEYREKRERANRLATNMLKQNGVKVRTNRAYELVYAVYYAVFDGEIPDAIIILLVVGRIEMLVYLEELERK